MSILVKPYEVSVWEDVWDSSQSKFIEKRILVIGSHLMHSQNRILAPNLITNVNGTKKFTFQLYKRYRDNITGEIVNNPFFNYLVNERKVKLKYEDKWYDFIIKNISETSETYLYTYSLEDAFVNELSRNGFNVEFSSEINNNLGTAQVLAARALEDTDWIVDKNSEVFVQTNEEALVYLKIQEDLVCHRIKDQTDLTKGVDTSEIVTLPKDSQVLAFYSCCKERPLRFQFVYLPTNEAYVRDDKRVIINKNCQYYIDYENINEYTLLDNAYQFYLPPNFSLVSNPEILISDFDDKITDKVVSTFLRGKRYVFAQQTEYVSLLDKYLTVYTKEEQEYYGYVQTDYIAPVLITNLIDNVDFTNTSGWTPAISDNTQAKPTVEVAYGRWSDNSFITAQKDWSDQNFGNYDERISSLHFIKGKNGENECDGYIINSGFYTNRVALKNISPSQKFVLRVKLRNNTGTYSSPSDYFTPTIEDTRYNTSSGMQQLTPYAGILEGSDWEQCEEDQNTYQIILQVNDEAEGMTEEQFRDKKIKMLWYIKQGFYLEKAELFQYIEIEKDRILTPDDQSTEATILKTYYYYPKEQFKDALMTEDKLGYEKSETPDTSYKPVYSEGAQKVRTITAKESNYFNILQNIAETFEAWLEINIEHDDNGVPIQKSVLFKNYAGENNYAGFRYGVNLKNIQRTKDAKALTTKLVVKDNKNEHATDGTCSIMLAPSNAMGENYIYNFDYYVTQGLLDATSLDEYLYNSGCAISEYSATLLGGLTAGAPIGYYSYLSFLNNAIQLRNKQLVPLLISRNKLNANQTTAEEKIEAATNTFETAANNLYDITGVPYQFLNATSIGNETFEITKSGIQGIIHKHIAKGVKLLTIDTVGKPGFRLPDEVVLCDTKKYSSKNAPVVVTKWENNNTKEVYLEEDYFYSATARAVSNNISTAKSGTTTNDNLFSMVAYSIKSDIEITSKYSVFSPGSLGAPVVDSIEVAMPFEVPAYYSIESVQYEYKSEDDSISIEGEAAGFIYENGILSFTINSNDENLSPLDSIPLTLTITLKRDTPTFSIDFSSLEKLKQRDDVESLLKEIELASITIKTATEELSTTTEELSILNTTIQNLENEQQILKNEKIIINKDFYSKYYRFIQEGTWISEDYIEAETYYVDAQSVLYDSCYPAVTYTINVLELSQLPGYEHFSFNLGDKTYVEDKDFFGEEGRVEVIITETSKQLDSPDQNTIKVQTYKNQFQDLFQKITATTQTAQYNTGAYEKAVAMTEASNARKQAYLTGAITDLSSLLTDVGEQMMEQDATGVTIRDKANKGNKMKLTGSSILLGSFDETTNETKWVTGLTNKGIAADLITAGKINTGAIQIMSGNDATFRWDAYGLSAFDFATDTDGNITGKPDSEKFVRFDKYGIYGIDSDNLENPIDGNSWTPGLGGMDAEAELDKYATFALTWEGLKVTGANNVIANIGRLDGKIINVTKDSKPIFQLGETGDLSVYGNINASSGDIGKWHISADGELYSAIYSGQLGGQRDYITKSIYLCPEGQKNDDILNLLNLPPLPTEKKWAITAGRNFGVTLEGALYALDGQFSGDIRGVDDVYAILSQGDTNDLQEYKVYHSSGNIVNSIDEGPQPYSQATIAKFGNNINIEYFSYKHRNLITLPASNSEQTLLYFHDTADGCDIEFSSGAKILFEAYSEDGGFDRKEITASKIGTGVYDDIYVFKDIYENGKWERRYSLIPVTITKSKSQGQGTTIYIKRGDDGQGDNWRVYTQYYLTGTYNYKNIKVPSFVISEAGSIRAKYISAMAGELGDLKIFSDGGIGYIENVSSGSASFDHYLHLARDGLHLQAGNYGNGDSCNITINGLVVQDARHDLTEFQSYPLNLARVAQGGITLATFATTGTTSKQGSGLQIRSSGLFYGTSNIFPGDLTPSIREYSGIKFTKDDSGENCDITFEILQNGKTNTISISDLVFKGPYDIRYGSTSGTVIGRVYRMGPLVYGVVKNGSITDNDASNKTLYFCEKGTTTSVSLPAPSGSQSFAWFYKDNRSVSISIGGTSALSMTTGNEFGNPVVVGSIIQHYHYFCYSANEAYHPIAG